MASLLPDELLLQIFERCRAKDLRRLSLVCKSWRVAQSVFFSRAKVPIDSRAKADLLLTNNRLQEMVSDTLYFVSDRYTQAPPEMWQLIQALEHNPQYKRLIIHWQDHARISWFYSHVPWPSHLGKFVVTLNSLTYLCFHVNSAGCLDREVLFEFLRAAPKLERFELHDSTRVALNMSKKSFPQVTCPVLKKIVFNKLQPRAPHLQFTLAQVFTRESLLRLETLVTNDVLLLLGSLMPCLSRLVLLAANKSEPPPLTQFKRLEACCPKLVELEVQGSVNFNATITSLPNGLRILCCRVDLSHPGRLRRAWAKTRLRLPNFLLLDTIKLVRSSGGKGFKEIGQVKADLVEHGITVIEISSFTDPTAV